MNDASTSHKPIQKWALISLLVFFLVGGMIALPCMCEEGLIKGAYKMAMYFAVILRLLYGLLKRNLRPLDFVVWCGFFLVFAVLVELS